MFSVKDVGLVRMTNGESLEILSDIFLEIPGQKITALIGPSGAGKSSFLRLLNRLEDPSRGSIFYKDKLLADYHVLELRRKVGMVFQLPVMFPGTVTENIGYAGRFNEKYACRKPTGEYLEMVGLKPEFAERNAAELSVGEQQRVSIARTLAGEPEVLLLDEPTASLDPASAVGVLNLLKELQNRLGLTVVMVTHILQQAREYAAYTGFIERGRLIEFGETRQIFEHPVQSGTRNFVTGSGGEN